ncbi:hypothetical protein GOV04_00070 [Candidatus Woesearchaeota archaeon]|nr:hypothetical protein [Candidatus Woesearchaeota archaeon]
MTRQEQLEKEHMGRCTMLVQESLMFRTPPRGTTHAYVVSNTRFNRVSLGVTTAVNIDAQGKEIPGDDLEAFIEEKLTEPECAGVVPITQEGIDLLKNKFKLEQPITIGVGVGGNYRAALFGYEG